MEAQLPACRAVAHPQRAAQRAGFSAHAVGEEDDVLSKSHRCERPSSTGGRWVRHQRIDDLLPIPDAARGAELLEVPVQQHLYLMGIGTIVRPEESPSRSTTAAVSRSSLVTRTGCSPLHRAPIVAP